MPIERVTLELETKALYAARVTAEAENLSVSEWISKVVWDQAIWHAAQSSAEQDRLHPDEPPGWEQAALDRIFGEDEA
ncbi:hypothetical protein ACWKSP_37760 [Micromonosporaceae bacterium Da 78-11]